MPGKNAIQIHRGPKARLITLGRDIIDPGVHRLDERGGDHSNRGRKSGLNAPPPSEPDRPFSGIRLSSQ